MFPILCFYCISLQSFSPHMVFFHLVKFRLYEKSCFIASVSVQGWRPQNDFWPCAVSKFLVTGRKYFGKILTMSLSSFLAKLHLAKECTWSAPGPCIKRSGPLSAMSCLCHGLQGSTSRCSGPSATLPSFSIGPGSQAQSYETQRKRERERGKIFWL